MTMSYDDGMIFDKRLIEIFNRYGIKGTFNLNSGLYDASDDKLPKEEIVGLYEGHEVATHTSTHPTCHHNAPDLLKKGQWLLDFQKWQYLKLMYVWGHSYEFDRDNNWEVIEDFCRLMGGHDDIWYATNIEIIDYMNVLNRLQFSAKCDMVWNPSAQSAWLQDENGNPFEISGGTCRKIPEPMKGKTT